MSVAADVESGGGSDRSIRAEGKADKREGSGDRWEWKGMGRICIAAGEMHMSTSDSLGSDVSRPGVSTCISRGCVQGRAREGGHT